MRGLVVCLLLLINAGLCAQDKLIFGDTPTTTKSPKYKSNPKEYKEKRPIQWVKSNSKGLLIGNPCMEEVMKEMGFTYLVQPKGQEPNKNEFQRNVYNFFAKIRITLRNGPFWKFKLKKWRNQCRAETSDFVG